MKTEPNHTSNAPHTPLVRHLIALAEEQDKLLSALGEAVKAGDTRACMLISADLTGEKWPVRSEGTAQLPEHCADFGR